MTYTVCVSKGRSWFRIYRLTLFGAVCCACRWWFKGYGVALEKDGEE